MKSKTENPKRRSNQFRPYNQDLRRGQRRRHHARPVEPARICGRGFCGDQTPTRLARGVVRAGQNFQLELIVARLGTGGDRNRRCDCRGTNLPRSDRMRRRGCRVCVAGLAAARQRRQPRARRAAKEAGALVLGFLTCRLRAKATAPATAQSGLDQLKPLPTASSPAVPEDLQS